jgi:hypothetical protein
MAGFPHSGISGLTLSSNSPELFAESHALLRLLLPRHPPLALLSLDHITLINFKVYRQYLSSLLFTKFLMNYQHIN